MELHYRGAVYEASDNALDVVEGQVIGQYRGAVLRSHDLRQSPAQQPKPRIKYRGAWVK